MELLPPETMPAVPHVTFSIFNLAIPNLIAWGILILGVIAAAAARLPKLFEPAS